MLCLGIALYVIGWVWEFNRSYPTAVALNGEDYPHNAAVAGAVALIWPVLLVIALVLETSSWFAEKEKK